MVIDHDVHRNSMPPSMRTIEELRRKRKQGNNHFFCIKVHEHPLTATCKQISTKEKWLVKKIHEGCQSGGQLLSLML